MNETNSNLDGVVREMSNAGTSFQQSNTRTNATAIKSPRTTGKQLYGASNTGSIAGAKTITNTARQPSTISAKPQKTNSGSVSPTINGNINIGRNKLPRTPVSPNPPKNNPPNNPPDNTVSCPDGYKYSAINNTCYKCPDGYVYNEADNNCYPISDGDDNDTIDDGGGYGGGYTPIPPSETQPAEGGYATEDTKVDGNGEQKMKEKSMKKVDKKYFWYAGIVAGLLIIGYLVKKNK